jgi:hypothetical protein
MNFLVISLFIVVFFVDLLTKKLDLISRYFVVLPELLSAIALLILVARSVAGKRWQLDWRYCAFFGLLLLILMVSAVAQSVSSGAVVAGLRQHLRFLPFFLLPAVYEFSARQLRSQLIVLMTLLSIQLPVVVYQRFYQFGHKMHTGDVVTGTTSESGGLSLVLICGFTAAVLLYLKRRITFAGFLVFASLYFAPTMFNETKITIILFPIAVIAPLFFLPRSDRTMSRVAPLFATGIAAGIAFIAVYNYMIQYRVASVGYGDTIEEFFTQGGIERYLYRGTVEGDTRIGRFDSIELAVDNIARDPITAVFGFGPGNVSTAFLPGFEGDYSHYVDIFGTGLTQVTQVLWELGFAGILAYALLYFFLLRDARYLARTDGQFALLGQIWGPIVLIMAAAWLYKAFFAMNPVAFPFWFYAGIVASKACALRRTQRQNQHHRQRQTPSPSWGHAPAKVPSMTASIH